MGSSQPTTQHTLFLQKILPTTRLPTTGKASTAEVEVTCNRIVLAPPTAWLVSKAKMTAGGRGRGPRVSSREWASWAPCSHDSGSSTFKNQGHGVWGKLKLFLDTVTYLERSRGSNLGSGRAAGQNKSKVP